MKKSSFTTFNRVVILAAFLCSTMVFAQAQDIFDGTTGNQLWSDPANWRDGHLPTEQSLGVIIRSNVIVDMDAAIFDLSDAVSCNLTIQEGKKLTVSNGIWWDKGGDFVLEDGAQLVRSDWNLNGLQVLVLKKIQAQTDEHPWNLIASPVMEDIIPSIENGILTDHESEYALYSYDASHHEWVSYKETPFALANGYGYLYANALDTVLQFRGTARGSNSVTEVGLAFYPDNGNMAGCNFVGNPLTCNAVVSRSYYVFDEGSNYIKPVTYSSNRPVAPCTGIVVEAKEENDTVSFYYGGPYLQTNADYLEISAAKSNSQNTILDMALISFNSDDDLIKYVLVEDAPRVYFTKDDCDLSIISLDSVDMLPLKFKVEVSGSYMLHFDPKEINLNYLHLIDNMTGANVDLLTTPNYTFDANPNDYPSRFRLIFDPHYAVEEFEDATFAYYRDGTLFINNIETQSIASLQVCDLIGRVIISVGDVSGSVSTNGMAPGVYVLRLVTREGVRTQKVVIN